TAGGIDERVERTGGGADERTAGGIDDGADERTAGGNDERVERTGGGADERTGGGAGARAAADVGDAPSGAVMAGGAGSVSCSSAPPGSLGAGSGSAYVWHSAFSACTLELSSAVKRTPNSEPAA